ncbi:MAG TPA: threonine/serine dehydratase [Actinobacteria bacterium]|nr:phenylserine dehydratase [bacterium BMS3Bbin01]HDH25575.1 threonine/serine dehydratase [Actinomycetota bacterium]
MGRLPVFEDVQAAADRIAVFVHRTPIMTSATLDRDLGASVFFKCENLQKIGAFKARGAVNAVLSLDEDTAARGVVTHSSGNHGQALAYAASIRKIPCAVVMPDTAPRIKVDAVRGYGADVVFCAQSEREATAEQVCAERGATIVHPFNDPVVIAGQGTAALELVAQVEGLDLLVAPIGGGGLLSGTTLVAEALLPSAPVVGAEPEMVDDAYRSLISGFLQPRVSRATTIADGLITGMGELAFEILRERKVEIVTVSEEQIVVAARFFAERMKLVVEPSGATSLAAIRAMGGRVAGLRVGVIVSGGNTDFSWLHR